MHMAQAFFLLAGCSSLFIYYITCTCTRQNANLFFFDKDFECQQKKEVLNGLAKMYIKHSNVVPSGVPQLVIRTFAKNGAQNGGGNGMKWHIL